MNNLKNAVEGGRSFPIDAPAQAPARYGDFAPVPKIHRIDLGVERVGVKMGIGGSFIWAYKASSTGVVVDFQFNSQQADKMSFYVGTSLAGLKFSEVFVSHAAQAGGWIDFFVIDQGSGITGLNPANVFTSVTLAKPTSTGSPVAVTITAAAAAAALVAADATRHELIVQSDPANVQDIRVGDLNTGAARGLVLQPGDVLTLKVTDTLF